MPPGSRRHALVVAALVLLAGCTSRNALGLECVFNDDCDAPLVCAGGRCRAQCRTDRDCPAGAACSASDSPAYRVCLPPDAAQLCAPEVPDPCPARAACAADRTCRLRCAVDGDCASVAPPRCDVARALCEGPLLVGAPRDDAGAPPDAPDAATPDAPDAPDGAVRDASDEGRDAATDAPPPADVRLCADEGGCPGGTVCQGALCVACGAAGQPCCGGSACAGDAVCLGGRCATCGAVGEACCTAPRPACGRLQGFCSPASTCTDFGGAGVESMSPPATTLGCTVPNPYAPAATPCGCPMEGVFRRLSADAALVFAPGATRPARLDVCALDPAVTGPRAAVDWDGFYQDDPAATGCEAGCRVPNPYTGRCSCPEGATPIELPVVAPQRCTPAAGNVATTLAFCWRAGRTPGAFGGAFQQGSRGGCRVSNPATRGCECPRGFQNVTFFTLDPADSAVTLYNSVCVRRP